jgi:hypothetical protein
MDANKLIRPSKEAELVLCSYVDSLGIGVFIPLTRSGHCRLCIEIVNGIAILHRWFLHKMSQLSRLRLHALSDKKVCDYESPIDISVSKVQIIGTNNLLENFGKITGFSSSREVKARLLEVGQ